MEVLFFYLALIVLILFLCGQLYWFMFHGFLPIWQQLGPGSSYALILPPVLALAGAIVYFRDQLLAIHFAPHPLLAFLGLAAYLANARLYRLSRPYLPASRLLGKRALEDNRGDLQTKGIFAVTRNPRYLSAWLFVFAMALITNYLAIYILLLWSLPAFHLITLLEERELRRRFGQDYRGFIPMVGKAHASFRSTEADINADGVVDLSDYSWVASNWLRVAQ
jgi:protein-S-isoprenylcysteine O-methyltransferase Ste14